MYKVLTGIRPLDASAILNEGFPKDLLIQYGRSETLIGIVEKSMSPMKKDRFQNVSEIIGLLPKNEIKNHTKKEDIQKSDVVQNEGTVIDKSKKKKTTQSKVVDIRSADCPNSFREFVNFSTLPSCITIHFLGKDNNWCQLWITSKYIKGEGDRHFKSKGTKKIKEEEFHDIVNELDLIICKHNLPKSEYNSRNIDIWYGDKILSDYFSLDSTALAEFCKILPYNKQFRLHRFINENTSDINNNLSSDNEEESTPKSKLSVFLNKFSERGTVWHEIKLISGIVIVPIMLLLISVLARNNSKDNSRTLNQSENQQYYQIHSAEIDSLITKTANEVLNKQSE